MAGLAFNTVICTTPRFYQKNHESRSSNLCRQCAISSPPAFAFPNSASVSGRTDGEGKQHRSWRWRTRAVARTAVEEGVADAKRVIDEVLMSRGGDGKGGLAEVSWALYADEGTKQLLEDAVTKLSACRGQDFAQFLSSDLSHGVWEVFYAPHIFRLSSAVRTQVRPLQYILTDAGFTSHAGYFSPVGQGWFSAAGDYVVRDGKTVEILFDSFWADAGRNNLQPDPKGKGSIERTLVNLAGRGAFVSALSVYPVFYADSDVTVFEFTTLRTKIAARKIRTA
ncbi:hypothetical protein KC19_1G103900 [Ceratodon purpureus]|uniref:Uncharacterized protein n=1 Tax=Ceratodon purpureus TaxID=3225 RepID=A0A8T0J4L8_CERPU|nr:hypothetical protein KC19_1G103900 [Ceratodon purpureus]